MCRPAWSAHIGQHAQEAARADVAPSTLAYHTNPYSGGISMSLVIRSIAIAVLLAVTIATGYMASAQTRNCHTACNYNPFTHSQTCNTVCF
jgi:hypothetical protein